MNEVYNQKNSEALQEKKKKKPKWHTAANQDDVR